jgi:hypothetical protein
MCLARRAEGPKGLSLPPRSLSVGRSAAPNSLINRSSFDISGNCQEICKNEVTKTQANDADPRKCPHELDARHIM